MFVRKRLACLAVAWCFISAVGRGEEILRKDDLFVAGQGGYALYRIPGLVVAPSGRLLVYAEARRGRSDWGAIDLMTRLSTPDTQRWSPPQITGILAGPHRKNPVAVERNSGRPGEVTYNNPVAIVDRRSSQGGVIHFVYCLEYERCFYQRSDHEGATFSQPREITEAFAAFRPRFDWRVLATGPGHGIQLENGRLVVPVWLALGSEGNGHAPSAIATIFSDDGGKQWQAGEIVAVHGGPLANPSEMAIAQLPDGRVMLNIRSTSPQHRRATALSPDGATGWTTPTFDDQLAEPICMGSLCQLRDTAAGGKDRLLFANPDNLARAQGDATPGKGRDRKNLTIKLSYDQGRTWPVAKTLESQSSGYSDLAVGPDGMIYCFYERGKLGDANQPPSLTLARFNLEWLTDGQDRYQAASPPQ